MYLGAKHMVTGYDHLLFLVGVIFFLYRRKDILLYVSLFTLGHSLSLLGVALGGIHTSAYLVDAVIGFLIVYKAFENMGGFKALGGRTTASCRRRAWWSVWRPLKPLARRYCLLASQAWSPGPCPWLPVSTSQ